MTDGVLPPSIQVHPLRHALFYQCFPPIPTTAHKLPTAAFLFGSGDVLAQQAIERRDQMGTKYVLSSVVDHDWSLDAGIVCENSKVTTDVRTFLPTLSTPFVAIILLRVPLCSAAKVSRCHKLRSEHLQFKLKPQGYIRPTLINRFRNQPIYILL